MSSLQSLVSNFIQENDLECAPEYRFLDLNSELGELAKEMLKATDYGKKPFRCSDSWKDELGDVLFSLLALAQSTGVSTELALKDALKKYQMRMDSKGSASSGN